MNRDSNNENKTGKNLTDIRTEFEGLKTILIEDLCRLRQQLKKISIEKVNTGKDIMNSFRINYNQK